MHFPSSLYEKNLTEFWFGAAPISSPFDPHEAEIIDISTEHTMNLQSFFTSIRYFLQIKNVQDFQT